MYDSKTKEWTVVDENGETQIISYSDVCRKLGIDAMSEGTQKWAFTEEERKQFDFFVDFDPDKIENHKNIDYLNSLFNK